jgi:mevalonate kinase
MSAPGVGTGSGKVILLGEHAVVHGHPALAGSLDRGVCATACAGAVSLSVDPWGLLAHAGGTEPVDRAFAAILAATGASGMAVAARAEIPVRAGLGSSAALAAAVARALSTDPARVRAAVDAAERVFHGNPSGIDATLALGSGFVCFRRDRAPEKVPALPLTLCIGDSGRPRDTRTMVERVAARQRRCPEETGRLLGEIGALAEDGAAALAAGRLEDLGRLVARNHELLATLGVSCEEIEQLCATARRAGALGAKLTGAGGGGCVLALAPGREEDVLEAWRGAGYGGFVAEVGA